MKESPGSVIRFPLLVSIALILSAVAFFGIGLGGDFRLGFYPIGVLLHTLLFMVLVTLYLFWILNLISIHRLIRPRFLAIITKWTLTYVYFYLAAFIGFLCFQKRWQIRESYISFNNITVLSATQGRKHERILLLVPHCLQFSECQIRITTDIFNCASCGRCDIGRIRALAEKHAVSAAVATGGSLARKIVNDTSPEVIIAVACHRDLTEGVRDAWSYPVYGVFNQRPNGPCFNTKVDIESIEKALENFK